MKGGMFVDGSGDYIPPPDTTTASPESKITPSTKKKLGKAAMAVGGAAVLTAASVGLTFGAQAARHSVGVTSATGAGIAGGALLPVLVGAAALYRMRGQHSKAKEADDALRDAQNGNAEAADALLGKMKDEEVESAAKAGVEAAQDTAAVQEEVQAAKEEKKKKKKKAQPPAAEEDPEKAAEEIKNLIKAYAASIPENASKEVKEAAIPGILNSIKQKGYDEELVAKLLYEHFD